MLNFTYAWFKFQLVGFISTFQPTEIIVEIDSVTYQLSYASWLWVICIFGNPAIHVFIHMPVKNIKEGGAKDRQDSPQETCSWVTETIIPFLWVWFCQVWEYVRNRKRNWFDIPWEVSSPKSYLKYFSGKVLEIHISLAEKFKWPMRS